MSLITLNVFPVSRKMDMGRFIMFKKEGARLACGNYGIYSTVKISYITSVSLSLYNISIQFQRQNKLVIY